MVAPPLTPIGPVPAGFVPASAAHAGDFVAACYTMYGDGNVPLEPAPAGVPAGYTIHDYIVMSDFLITGRRIQAFYGFIATSADGSESVVAMRGTVGSTEWIDNLLFVGFMPFVVDGKSLGDVHKGFGTIYQSIAVIRAGLAPTASIAPDMRPFSDKVASSIAAHRAAKGLTSAPARITVAAHSLGGALLTLYVLENETKRSLDQVVAYTFASPRVGDQTFVDSYDALQRATTYRVFLKEDLVPNLPPDVWGYRHVNAAVQYSVAGAGIVDSVACHHALSTYLYTLSPAGRSLGACKA
jgi:hypothetical protein